MELITVTSLHELDVAASQILTQYNDVRFFALQGDLGAGKTALVKAFTKHLAIEDEVSSPTFSLVNEYGNPPCVYHFDLYRLATLQDILQIGFEDYLDSGHYCFIEWPEKITMLLPPHKSKIITIVMKSNNIREITIHDL